jgi:hypothetical protein
LAFQWVLTGAAVLAALAAFIKARRLGKRFERLTESYWELRYELTQVRARVNRLDPEQPPAGPEAPLQAGTIGTTAFVPLSSLKRPD